MNKQIIIYNSNWGHETLSSTHLYTNKYGRRRLAKKICHMYSCLQPIFQIWEYIFNPKIKFHKFDIVKRGEKKHRYCRRQRFLFVLFIFVWFFRYFLFLLLFLSILLLFWIAFSNFLYHSCLLQTEYICIFFFFCFADKLLSHIQSINCNVS